MIKIDSNRLRSETKPIITNAISNLNQASSLLKEIKIPDNFCYLSDLKGIPSQIDQIVTDVKGINTYIDQKTAEFDAVRQAVLSSNLNWSLSYQGGTKSGGLDIMAYNDLTKNSIEYLKNTRASVVNYFVPLTKGIEEARKAIKNTRARVIDLPSTIITEGRDIVQSVKEGKKIKNIDFKNTNISILKNKLEKFDFNQYIKTTKANWCNSIIRDLNIIGNIILDPIAYAEYKVISKFDDELKEADYRNISDTITEYFYSTDSGRRLNIDADDAYKSYVLSNTGLTSAWPFTVKSKSKIEKKSANSADEFFSSNYSNKYGIDQDVLSGTETADIFELAKKVEKRYNMNENDSIMFVQCIDSIGACSYANLANSIVLEYRNKPKEFEHIFGFPLYIKNDEGKKILDDKSLIMDLYFFYNSEENGGTLFKKNKDGKTFIEESKLEWNDEDKEYTFTEQKYAPFLNGMKIKKYISSKKNVYNKNLINGLDVNTDYIIDTKESRSKLSDEEIKEIMKEVEFRLKCDETLMIAEFNREYSEPINFLDPDSKEVYISTDIWEEGDGHITQITGIQDDGLIVSTWGKRLLVPMNDLKRGAYIIESINIE